jgi:hypothetical protein
MTQPQVQAVGMPWFRRETFDVLRAMFEDGHKLHRTYDEWLRAAETGRKSMEVKGVRVVCADLDPHEFPEWCKAKGLKLNAHARMEYANSVAYQVLTGQRPG